MNYLQKNFLGLLTLLLVQSVALGTFDVSNIDLSNVNPPTTAKSFAAFSQKVRDVNQYIQTSNPADIVADCQEFGRKITPQIVVKTSALVAEDAQTIGTFLGEKREAMRSALDSAFSGKNSLNEYFETTHKIDGNQATTAQATSKVAQEVVTLPGQLQVVSNLLEAQSKTFSTVNGLMQELYKPREGFAGVHTAQDQANIAAVITHKNVPMLPLSSADAGLIGVAHGLADETGVPFISLLDTSNVVDVVGKTQSNQTSASLVQDTVTDMNARSSFLQNNVSSQMKDMDLRLTIKETNARLGVVEQVNQNIGEANKNIEQVSKGMETIGRRLEKIENKLNEKSRFEKVTQYVQENPLKVAAGAVVTVAAVYGVYRLVVYVKELRSEKELLKAQLAL